MSALPTRACALPLDGPLDALPLLPKMIRGEVTYEELDQEDMVIVGDVDHVIRKLERYRDAGAGRVLCLMHGARIPHPAVMKSIELFGKYVIPEFDRG